MKDILNQVVQAEKIAQANVIKRREETSATRSLLNTAKLMDENPTLLAPGDHLIRITAPLAHWSHATLRHTMTELLTPDPTT